MRPVRTKTLIARLKREAKTLAKRDGISHTEALEQLSRDAGFASWHELVHAEPSTAPPLEEYKTDPRLPPLPTHLPIDPILPRNFDSTPNEDRSTRQLDLWWDRPFAVTNQDGSLTVRVLAGGSWDRSTSLGRVQTLEEGLQLARRELAAWRAKREKPMVYLDERDGVHLVRMPQRPDWEEEYVMTSATDAEVRAWLSKHYPSES
jgi:hypothetical protein